MAFAKGQSGNPSGRPKRTEEEARLVKACRDMTEEAVATVVDVMRSGEQERNRMEAAKWVIDRGWGKALERVEMTGEDGDAIKTETELVIRVVSANGNKPD